MHEPVYALSCCFKEFGFVFLGKQEGPENLVDL